MITSFYPDFVNAMYHSSPTPSLCTPAGEEQRQGVRLRVRSRVRPRVRLRVRPGPPTRARSAVGEPAPVCRILEAGHHTPNLGPREAAHTVLASRTAPVMEVPRVNTDVAPRWRPRRPGLATQSQVPSNYAQKYGSKTNCHNQETVANQSRIGVANSVRPALISVSQNGSSASLVPVEVIRLVIVCCVRSKLKRILDMNQG